MRGIKRGLCCTRYVKIKPFYNLLCKPNTGWHGARNLDVPDAMSISVRTPLGYELNRHARALIARDTHI